MLRAAEGTMDWRISKVSMFSWMGRLLMLSPFLSREISNSAVPRVYCSCARDVRISISMGTLVISSNCLIGHGALLPLKKYLEFLLIFRN